MDRITKFLQRLDEKMKDRVEACFLAIRTNSYQHLDVQPLKGFTNVYRCRVGTVRIIFTKYPHENTIVDVDFRKNVYRRLKR